MFREHPANFFLFCKSGQLALRRAPREACAEMDKVHAFLEEQGTYARLPAIEFVLCMRRSRYMLGAMDFAGARGSTPDSARAASSEATAAAPLSREGPPK